MAFCIELRKIKNEKDCVYYSYEYYIPFETYISKSGKQRYRSKLTKGELKLHKESGEIDIVTWAEGESVAHMQRAKWALIKHWRNGEFPETTTWAS